MVGAALPLDVHVPLPIASSYTQRAGAPVPSSTTFTPATGVTSCPSSLPSAPRISDSPDDVAVSVVCSPPLVRVRVVVAPASENVYCRFASLAVSRWPAASYVRPTSPIFVARPAASYANEPAKRSPAALSNRLSAPYAKVVVVAEPSARVVVFDARLPLLPSGPVYAFCQRVSCTGMVPTSLVSISRPSAL